jgi:hypothetical protein
MRSLVGGALLAVLSGCAHAPSTVAAGPRLELQLDDGTASERPLTPNQTFEMLMRFEPRLPSWRLRRLRFLLAQAGTLAFTFYGDGADGHPGAPLLRVERSYDPQLVSTGKDGRWVVEELDAPPGTGAFWLGIHAPGGGDARLWASSNRAAVYQRDPDPATPFSSTKIPRTPIVRIEVAPSSP